MGDHKPQEHIVSVVVWGYPEYVEAGSKLRLKVGALCYPYYCDLSGTRFELYDESGRKVAEGALGPVYSEEIRRHYAEVEVTAPERGGVYRWTARFVGDGNLHGEALWEFRLKVTEPLRYTVRIKVIESGLKMPIRAAEVVVDDFFHGVTDHAGEVVFRLPPGRHMVEASVRVLLSQTVRRRMELTVDRDMDVQLEVPIYEETECVPSIPSM